MNKFFALCRRIVLEIHKDPMPSIQIVVLLLLFISTIATIYEWSDLQRRTAVEVPLLLVGVMAILMIVLRTTQGFTLSVAVLIIGTVVAGDRFMLAITALLKGESEQTIGLVNDLYGNKPLRTRVQENPTDIAERIVELVEKSDKPEIAVEKVIKSVQLDDLANEVSNEGANTPLEYLASGGEIWTNWASEFVENTFFKEDMRFLRDNELATFTGNNFLSAEITSLGINIVTRVKPSRNAFFSLPRGNEIDQIEESEFVQLTLDSPIISNFKSSDKNWFEFDISKSGKYVITTKSSNFRTVDTLMKLYAADKLTVIAEDDDSGDDLFSEISSSLEQGKYYLQISSIFSREGEYSVSLVQKENHNK